VKYTKIRLELVDKVAILAIVRPEVKNALDFATLHQIGHALDRITSEPGIRAMVLTGTGGSFCAGADIMGMAAEDSTGATKALGELFNPLLERLHELPIPLICAVNGAAAGGGFAYALAGDIVIAARSAYFLLPFAKLGLVPDVGVTWILPRLAGFARASAMMLLGDRIPAERAEQWGMIWQVVDDAALLETALGIARKLADGPTIAFRLTRAALREAQNLTLRETLALEVHNQALASQTEDCGEGLAAMSQKRPPHFQGH
jgi:2-(1,2-epoxy-1,2-dihydrophenyl)acetyl-CoA isomerase